MDVQAHLLRVLETQEVLPVGEVRTVRVDVRFLAASNRSLKEAVAQGAFRADLLARLEGFRIELPPLRARRGDVPFLFLHLLREFSGRRLCPDSRLLERVCLHDWPLNVRELASFARRCIVANPGADNISFDSVAGLFPELPCPTVVTPRPDQVRPRRRRVDPRTYCPEKIVELKAALERHSGSVARAAAELDITRQRAYRMLRSDPR